MILLRPTRLVSGGSQPKSVGDQSGQSPNLIQCRHMKTKMTMAANNRNAPVLNRPSAMFCAGLFEVVVFFITPPSIDWQEAYRMDENAARRWRSFAKTS